MLIHKQYYKPWELQSGEEEKIKTQIDEAREIINQELSQFNIDNPSGPENYPSDARRERHREPEKTNEEDAEMDGKDTNTGAPELPQISGTDTNNTAMSEAKQRPPTMPETTKDNGDDGGEVVEGDEDTVIY